MELEPQVGFSVAAVTARLTGIIGDATGLGVAIDNKHGSDNAGTAGAIGAGAATGSGLASGITADIAAGIAREATRRTEAFDLFFAAPPLSITDATAAHASIAAAPAVLVLEPPSGAAGCAWMGEETALAEALPRGATTGLPTLGPTQLTKALPALYNTNAMEAVATVHFINAVAGCCFVRLRVDAMPPTRFNTLA